MLTGRYLTRQTAVRRTVIRVPRRLKLVILLISVVARNRNCYEFYFFNKTFHFCHYLLFISNDIARLETLTISKASLSPEVPWM